jgi:hypothetical protein
MPAAIVTVDRLGSPGTGASRLAVSCAHRRTEFHDRPAGLPFTLRAGGCSRAAYQNSQADPRNSATNHPFNPKISDTELTSPRCSV